MRKRILAIVLSIALLLPTMASLVVFAETLPGPYTASEGFSGTQGQNQWYYQKYMVSTSTYSNLSNYHTQAQAWYESVYTPLSVKASTMSPDTVFDAVRKWVAPSGGEIRITGNVKKTISGGDGVVARVVKNGTVIWGPQAIAYDDTTGYDINVDTTITQNDAIYFIVNKGTSTSTYDSTTWNPTITYLPAVEWSESRYLFKDDTYLMNLEMDTTPEMFVDNLDGLIREDATIEILDANNNDMLDPNYDDSYEFLGTGFTVNVLINNQVDESYPVIYRGDCTQDGYIDGADLVTMRRHILGYEYLTGIYLIAADVDKDDDVDDDDVDIVTDYILGLTTIDQMP